VKLGYSNLLGEHLTASHLHHKDCEPFQIVCPSCREPIFKAERQGGVETIHYLSHYAADKAYHADCELRVASLNVNQVAQSDKISRDQRLKFFLAVLRDMIATNPIYQHGTDSAQTMLNRSKILTWLRTMHREHLVKQAFTQAVFEEMAGEYIDDLAKACAALDTSFAESTQRRIAYDVWRTVLSHAARSNFDFLFNHAYTQLIGRMARLGDARPLVGPERMLLGMLARLPQTSKRGGAALIREMAETPMGMPFATEGSTILSKALSEVCHEMVGTLLGLPYFEFLRDRRLGGRSDHG
jgi:hypothetical protein